MMGIRNGDVRAGFERCAPPRGEASQGKMGSPRGVRPKASWAFRKRVERAVSPIDRKTAGRYASISSRVKSRGFNAGCGVKNLSRGCILRDRDRVDVHTFSRHEIGEKNAHPGVSGSLGMRPTRRGCSTDEILLDRADELFQPKTVPRALDCADPHCAGQSKGLGEEVGGVARVTLRSLTRDTLGQLGRRLFS